MSDPTSEERISALRAELETARENVAAMTDPEAVSRALVPLAPGQVPAEAARAQAAQMRGQALKESTRIKEISKKLISEIEAQARAEKAAVEAMLAPLYAQMQVAEEKVWTINLYLGRDEEIVPLLDGEPAPADTAITLRQAVLTMDEETAASAAEGGIDARNIEVFDEWVKDPAHLAQVFPEQKGVVVLVPRRRGRDYQDPWMNETMRKENAWSYFLIRNGEKLFRMRTDFIVGKHLIPTTDEFTGLFVASKYNHKTRQTETHELIPGSKEWDDAAKRQDGRQRHFMRMALILQGLVDRTTVWHPLPAHGVNLLDNNTYESGAAELIRDAENLLTDGREDFYPWLKRLTTDLRVGMRVLGAFRTNAFNEAGGARSPSSENNWRGKPNKRVAPKNAEYPVSGQVYRLDGRKPLQGVQGFTFKYERSAKVYARDDRGREVLRAPKARASCTILPTDQFVIPYDLVTVDELRYYLGSRRQRHAYEHMFPLLHAAIDAKEAESAEEAPFRVLLAGELVKVDASLALDEATVRVEELVHWWKFTNKHHRALNGEPEHESQAVKDIVKEHLVRTGVAVAQSGDDAAEAAMVAKLLAQDPTIMVIGRKRDGGYLAFAPQPRTYPAGKLGYPATNITQPAPPTAEEIAANDALHPVHRDDNIAGRNIIPAAVAGNVWAVEYTSGKTGRSIKSREWTQPGTRMDSARILHTTAAWNDWDLHAAPNDHLTDPEIDAALADIIPEVEAYAIAGWPSTRRINGHTAEPFTPLILGVCLNASTGEYNMGPRFEVHLITDDNEKAARDTNKGNLKYGKVRVFFTKTARNGLKLKRHTDGYDEVEAPWTLKWDGSTYSNAPAGRPWHYFWDGKAREGRALVSFPEHQAVAAEQVAAIEAAKKVDEDVRERSAEPIWVIKKAWEARAEAEAYARFIEEYADPELWEGHKKTLHSLEAEIHPHGRGVPDSLHEALRRFITADRPLEGHTVRSVIEACNLPLDDVAEDLLDLPVWEEPAPPAPEELEAAAEDDDPDNYWNDDE